MNPTNFEQANKTLTAPDKTYSDNVTGVEPLRVWTDGEQCVSCWRMTWRERLAALVHGHVWVSVLTGGTQPPMYAEAAKTYFRGA